MLRKRLVAMTALFAMFAAPVQAKSPCYTPDEFEAEQGIRLHTELMVVGLTCQEMSVKGQPSLFAQYKMFTLKNQKQIQTWENNLIAYYKRTVKGNANRAFDTFRTRLANETSQRAIALTNPVFCADHVAAVAKAMTTDIGVIRASLRPDAPGFRLVQEPRCDKPMQGALVAEAATTPAARSSPSASPSKKVAAKKAAAVKNTGKAG
ncbi:hypothetical protein GE253_21055 [Niveispirillum sp. SYP-B3756]|uniref:hypothetical protein n=1 Tax=Niveispirillum sp. SYP-B3756 TaxID=2662178 RepID=UPI001290F9FA|nr:hypothetical protein [Niveispirillum sp. SYP-B3756]MQP67815.1 hypothetical protein [Niveispirillum sp. SYP-B3756]